MLGSKVALIVDDEIFARLMMTQILVDDDYCVLEASNAAEALDVLDRNDDVELMITDISMPGELDGLALAKNVLSQHPGMITVLTSGFDAPVGDEVPERARFLPKPYTANALRSIIRELNMSAAT